MPSFLSRFLVWFHGRSPAVPLEALEAGAAWPWTISRWGMLIISGAAIMAAAVTVDSILPAFYAISQGLQVPVAEVALAIPAFFVGLSIGQFYWGPWSDEVGRRLPIAIGFALFALGSLLAALSPSFELFLFARVLQGIGAAAPYLLGRALLRDCYKGDDLAWAMAMSSTVFAIGPIIGPLIGWVLMDLFGWRSIFTFTFLYSLVMIGVIVFIMPETLRQSRPLRLNSLIAGCKQVMQNRQSLTFGLVAAISATSLVGMLALLPIYFVQVFGVSEFQFALIFGCSGFAIIGGQQVNGKLIRMFGPLRTAKMGSLYLLSCGLATLILGLLGIEWFWYGILLLFWFFSAYLTVFTNSAALVMDPHGNLAGLTAAIYGFFTMGLAALIYALFEPLFAANTYGLGLMISLFGIVSAVLAWSYKSGASR